MRKNENRLRAADDSTFNIITWFCCLLGLKIGIRPFSAKNRDFFDAYSQMDAPPTSTRTQILSEMAF
jgi:hypothetical protein